MCFKRFDYYENKDKLLKLSFLKLLVCEFVRFWIMWAQVLTLFHVVPSNLKFVLRPFSSINWLVRLISLLVNTSEYSFNHLSKALLSNMYYDIKTFAVEHIKMFLFLLCSKKNIFFLSSDSNIAIRNIAHFGSITSF